MYVEQIKLLWFDSEMKIRGKSLEDLFDIMEILIAVVGVGVLFLCLSIELNKQKASN